MDREELGFERDWGRPDGRPFDPKYLTLEEWILLYRMLPTPGKGPDYIRVAVPGSMRLYDVHDTGEQCVDAMPVVEFHGMSYFSAQGIKGHLWRPKGASKFVMSMLKTAGVMNPVGRKY